MTPLFPAALVKRVALAWLAISALLLLTNWAAMAQMRFPDPDDALRLVEVRDLLAGQGWFDMHQHRIDPLNGGVLMHWSRLVDLPIAGVMLLFRPLLGAAAAELAALVFVPLLTLAAVLLLAGRIAWAKLGAEATMRACLVLAMSVPLIAQIRPLRIDHHGWQVATALAAVNGLMARDGRRGGWAAGLALALGLSISLEGLPLTLAFAAIGLWRWLRAGPDRFWLASFMQALALGSIASFAATRGLADLANHCDAVAPVHLAVFAFGALAVSGLALLPVQPLWRTLFGFGLAALGAVALVLMLAPQCAGGAFNELDPVVRRLWFDQISEGLPIWRQDWTTALQIAVPGVFGLCAALRLARAAAPQDRQWWGEYAALLGASLLIAILIARAGAVCGALAAIPLGWQLGQWLDRARQEGAAGKRVAALAGAMLAILPSAPITLYALVKPVGEARVGPSRPAVGSSRVSSCDIPQAGRMLATMPRGNILAPLDIGPELLLATPDTVLASSHHRGARAMREVIDAFTLSPDAAHAIVRRRRIGYLALCPGLGEPAIYAKAAPDGLMAGLLEGRVPVWLAPVEGARDGRMLIWRVLRD